MEGTIVNYFGFQMLGRLLPSILALSLLGMSSIY